MRRVRGRTPTPSTSGRVRHVGPTALDWSPKDTRGKKTQTDRKEEGFAQRKSRGVPIREKSMSHPCGYTINVAVFSLLSGKANQ